MPTMKLHTTDPIRVRLDPNGSHHQTISVGDRGETVSFMITASHKMEMDLMLAPAGMFIEPWQRMAHAVALTERELANCYAEAAEPLGRVRAALRGKDDPIAEMDLSPKVEQKLQEIRCEVDVGWQARVNELTNELHQTQAKLAKAIEDSANDRNSEFIWRRDRERDRDAARADHKALRDGVAAVIGCEPDDDADLIEAISLLVDERDTLRAGGKCVECNELRSKLVAEQERVSRMIRDGFASVKSVKTERDSLRIELDRVRGLIAAISDLLLAADYDDLPACVKSLVAERDSAVEEAARLRRELASCYEVTCRTENQPQQSAVSRGDAASGGTHTSRESSAPRSCTCPTAVGTTVGAGCAGSSGSSAGRAGVSIEGLPVGTVAMRFEGDRLVLTFTQASPAPAKASPAPAKVEPDTVESLATEISNAMGGTNGWSLPEAMLYIRREIREYMPDREPLWKHSDPPWKGWGARISRLARLNSDEKCDPIAETDGGL